MFGFGAKTFAGSSETCNLFPMSMKMSNPLIPNQSEILQDTYAQCLGKLKLDLPVKLTPLMQFIKSLA